MKLISLLLVSTLVFVEAFRLPQLDATNTDPLHLSTLFKSISTFFSGIDTTSESLKNQLNFTKRIPNPGPNPNSFFPYAHFESSPKLPINNTVTSWSILKRVCILLKNMFWNIIMANKLKNFDLNFLIWFWRYYFSANSNFPGDSKTA